MSGYPAGSGGDNKGLESLLAQLRQQNKPVHLEPSYSYYNNGGYFPQGSPSQAPQGYQQPSVTSPIPTPPVGGSQPHHASAVMSPMDSPRASASGGPSNADRTSSLLNLLKFSGASGGSSSQPAPIGTPLPLSRGASATFANPEQGRGTAGLLEALMGNTQPKPQQESPRFSPTMQPPQSIFGNASSPPSADTQAYLLSLLNQPKPAQSDNGPQYKPTSVLTPPSKASSQEDVDELTRALEESTMEYNMMSASATESVPAFANENVRDSLPKNAQGLFTYVNPFEQLAASSPRNRTPKIASAGPVSTNSPKIQILKRQEQSESNSISSPAYTKRKLDAAYQSSSSTPIPDGRTQIEALGQNDNKESVHDALSEVGDRADKEVQAAISRAENAESQASIEKDLRDLLAATTDKEFHVSAQHAASAIKHELEKEENSGALDSLPIPVAEEVKDIIDEAAHGNIADSWESADAEDSPTKEDENIVKVFNFPMRPWSAITIKEAEEARPTFRDEAVMDIARLKKEFDQIDRTLVTASNNFIVYGMSKNGGVRIIRQDDGKDARLFTETHDRIFSVVTSSSSAEQKESIIGTGISGTIYWAMIKDGEGDHIEDSNPEMYGFALPPIQTTESESPGGVLKTRARKSSGHPDFFAVGRGKYIHIIWPSVITKQSLLKKDRLVDTEKYLSKYSLKINTGKAGKDFTFSEDDTIVVSLDKAGRVKFWDVRSLTSSEIAKHPTRHQQIEIKDPLITLTTTPVTEKSWPTSVLFVDKLRPYQRGGALRYLIVGMKQNHTLQLWDLALGKPVQEIHLPHGKESDAVCSVLYHAATGMIVVGHPTRNSIYFLHLSAPKYNLPKGVNQAEYMEKLVAGDSSIAKPDSTAVISGMREYSFANKGMLRSLDILQTPNSASTSEEPATLFELYAMHSKGVTCLNIKQADLGWTSDNKVINPVEALPTGVITIDTLKEIATTMPLETTEHAPSTPAATRSVPRSAPKEVAVKDTPRKAQQGESSTSVPKVEVKAEKKETAATPSAPAPEKVEKEKRKRRKNTTESAPSEAPQVSQPSKPIVLDPMSHVRNGDLSKSTNIPPAQSSSITSPPLDTSNASLKGIETRVAGEVKKLFDNSFDALHSNIKDDRRTQAAVAEAKQDAMLRLVSSTLADNVEVTLDRIVSKGLQQSVTQSLAQSVIPALTKVAEKTISEQLGASVQAQLGQSLPKELQRVLPDVIGRALQQPQVLKLMSESLANSVAFRVEEHFAVLLQTLVTPAFQNMVATSTQRIAADVQRQSTEQIHAIEQHRHADSIKIEQLTQLVTGLTSTISSMAAAQTDFQAQFLRMQEQASSERRLLTQKSEGSSAGTRGSVSRPATALTAPMIEKSPAEKEYDAMLQSIDAAMGDGQYEIAVIQWLQTQQEQTFFKNYFVKYNPEFLRELSPLLLLSLGATISLDFTGDLLPQRISWMETILVAFQSHVTNGTMEPQVRDLIPKIMGIYIQRVEHLFMRISQVSGGEPLLKRLSSLVVAANRVLETSTPAGPSSGNRLPH